MKRLRDRFQPPPVVLQHDVEVNPADENIRKLRRFEDFAARYYKYGPHMTMTEREWLDLVILDGQYGRDF